LNTDPGLLRRNVDLAEIGHIQGVVRAKGAMARPLEAVMGQLGRRTLDPIDREVRDRATLKIHPDDAEADGRPQAWGRDRREVAEQGDERLPFEAERATGRYRDPICGGVRLERDDWFRDGIRLPLRITRSEWRCRGRLSR
jgi:hypothetical protein